MGRIRCQKHGDGGFWEMCGHVYENLQRGVYPEMKNLAPFDIKLCTACYDSLIANEMPDIDIDDILEMSETESMAIDKTFTRIYNKIPRRSVMCYACIQEVKSRSDNV